MGAKGTEIIFGGGVYVAENTSREASVELAAKGGLCFSSAHPLS